MLISNPAILDLGRQVTGSVVPIRFTIQNATREVVVLMQPKPDCGCLDVRLLATSLGPGESTALLGRVSIKSKKRKTPKISVPYTVDGRLNVLQLEVAYSGNMTRSVIEPKSLHLGKSVVASINSIVGEFRFAVEGAGEEEKVALDSAMSGDFATEIIGTSMDSGDGGTLRFRVGDLRSESFGLLSTPVEITLLDSRQVLVAEVSVNLVPPGIPESDWPDCRMVVSALVSDRASSLEFKHLQNPTLAKDAESILECSLSPSAGGHVLRVWAKAGLLQPGDAIHEETLTIRDDLRSFMVKVLIVG